MSAVRIEARDGILVAVIDRPAKRNAADLEVYHGLEDVLHAEAEGHVITGAGGDFSAGDDIAMFDFGGVEAATGFIEEVTELFRLIESVPRPVVAAVNGYALAFGFELALVCDAIVASPDSQFGLPEITLGAAPPNAMGRGVDVLGRGWIRHLALTGRHWIRGDEAHRRGMVAELHGSDAVVDAAIELARDMAQNPRFAHVKRLLTLDAERSYRMTPLVMGPVMATAQVAESGARYRPDD